MIIEYIVAVLSGMILDGMWLGLISKSLYRKYIGNLMLETPHFAPAVLFYLIFAIAAMMFVINPAIRNNWSYGNVALHGAMLGLVIYAGYDLTNLAILKSWPIGISLIDVAWGTTFSTLVCLITVYVSRLF